MSKNISPLDGRYSSQLKDIKCIFSEYGLMKYRTDFEYRYLIFILDTLGIMKLPKDAYPPFNQKVADSIKEYELKTNHDIKAIELYIKDNLPFSLEHLKNYVHFGLTSQDVNTTAYSLQLKDFTEKHYIPLLTNLISNINKKIPQKHIPMLSHTHGQPATPTTFNKEMFVFTTRLQKQLILLKNYKFSTKLGGAVGNLNAHKIAYPERNWPILVSEFLRKEFGLIRLAPTTQISHYDDYSELFSIYQRINTILIDFTRDIWQYISMRYIKQIHIEGETGSSTMPHKVNPIDFENAEANLQISNCLLSFLQKKLPISRLQRDLTDSTTLRNLGVTLGHSYLSIKSILRGLSKIEPNIQYILDDLNSHPEILSEAYQTILRTIQIDDFKEDPYDLFKKFTRGNENITLEKLHDFVERLPILTELKHKLKLITPATYLGYST